MTPFQAHFGLLQDEFSRGRAASKRRNAVLTRPGVGIGEEAAGGRFEIVGRALPCGARNQPMPRAVGLVKDIRKK
jgi:hypothetical protein